MGAASSSLVLVVLVTGSQCLVLYVRAPLSGRTLLHLMEVLLLAAPSCKDTSTRWCYDDEHVCYERMDRMAPRTRTTGSLGIVEWRGSKVSMESSRGSSRFTCAMSKCCIEMSG